MTPDNQNYPKQPILIEPTKKKNTMPGFLVWILSCVGGCAVFSIVGLIIVSLFISVIAAGATESVYESVIKDSKSTDKIAVIPVSGMIVQDTNSNDYFGVDAVASKTKINKLLDMASNDQNVSAIILRENTPGGSEQATREICTKLEEVGKNKPIYTYIESEGASGGYFIANCTKYIMADKYSITGSIGALAQFTDLQGLFDKLGIKTKTITNTKGVLKESDVFKPNSKDEQKIKALLDEIYGDFVTQIVKGRNQDGVKNKLTRDQVIALGTGEFYYGNEALDKGLIDETGSLDDMISTVITRESLSRDIKVTQYDYSTGFFGGVSYTLNKLVGNIPAVNVSTFDVWAVRQ